MRRTHIVTVVATGLALVLGSAAGCSRGGSITGQASPAAASNAAEASQTSEAARTATLTATDTAELGTILTDADGMTLYRFDKDTAKPPKSNCEGDCATAWPPATTSSDEITLNGVDKAVVGTVTRADGSRQLTIAGWPLYRYVKDTKPGDTNGQGAGGSWFAATPQGKKALAKPAAATSAPPVALVVMKVGDLGPIVTDREGMTLYRFDKDTAKPSKSNCEGDCAAAWPPVITASPQVQVDGVDPALVGTVARADGSLQVTIAGWPVYRFAKDTKPCDTNGQGVGGVWFAITAQGKKAGV